jgi:hypothetical protein
VSQKGNGGSVTVDRDAIDRNKNPGRIGLLTALESTEQSAASAAPQGEITVLKRTKQTNNETVLRQPPAVLRVLFLAWGSKREGVHYEEVFTQMGYESEIESD